MSKQVTWYLVGSPNPYATPVEPESAGVAISALVLDWATANGLGLDDPDVYLLVAPAGVADDAVEGLVAMAAGEVSDEDGRAIEHAIDRRRAEASNDNPAASELITPTNSPDRFTREEAEIFASGKCGYQVSYGVITPTSRPGNVGYCEKPSFPDADFGYCREHAYPDQYDMIEYIKGTVPVTEFWSEDSTCLLLAADLSYVVRVGTDGREETAYTSQQPLADLREHAYTSRDLPELEGFSPGFTT